MVLCDVDEGVGVAVPYEEKRRVAAEDAAEALALVVELPSASLALLRQIVRKWNRKRWLESLWQRP